MTIEFKNGVPTFFEQAPTICLRDPLAAFLGAAEGGLMTYSYQDAVKLAGKLYCGYSRFKSALW